jgi:4-amino-4-deoxy-L-arabinose transferase-like glycosyltransferase
MSMTLSRHSKLDMIVIFFCGLIFFTLGLKNQEIISFESRFYLFAQEMWRHGPTWFPTTYGVAYPDYPVTSTVLIYLSACLAGALNKLVAVLPSAIAAAGTLAMTYLLGALQTRCWGWYAAGFLLFTLAFLSEARTISLDMYVTLLTTACFYIVYARELQQKTPSFVVVAILLVMSFAIRGPIGLIIPTGVMCVFYLLEKKLKRFFQIGLLATSLLVLCAGVLLLLAYHAGGQQFMQYVMQMEVLGRMQEYKTPARYFYFVESLGAYAVTYPLAILILLGLGLQLIKYNLPQQIKFVKALFGWVLIIMLGLSIPGDKKIRYILPIAPALALICSYLFIRTNEEKYFRWLKTSFYYLCYLLPLLGIGVLSVLFYQKIELNYFVLLVSLIAIQIGMLMVHRQGLIFGFAVLAFILSYIFIVERINLDSNKTADFVKNTENLREIQHAKLVFYKEGMDGLAIKYLVNMPKEDRPIFVSNINDVSNQSAFIIANESNFNALSIELHSIINVISIGKLGHDKVIVFMLRRS